MFGDRSSHSVVLALTGSKLNKPNVTPRAYSRIVVSIARACSKFGCLDLIKEVIAVRD